MIATFDIGTTAVKGVLVEESGKVLDTASVTIDTIYDGEFKEQNPEDWYRAFCQISRRFLEIYPREQIDGIVMSGQMQDVIPVDRELKAVGNAILYSDGRARGEAGEMVEELSAGYLEQVTGNHYDGSLPAPKIKWLKKNRPDQWERTYKLLISSKDYVAGRLTGVAAGDVTACSTAGAMDIRACRWDEKILAAAGASPEQMPLLCHSHEVVGAVTEAASAESGYVAGTKVYAGAGDAGATTLASGITGPGEYNINLGTSGWVAAVSDRPVQTEGGVFNLAAMPEGYFINVVPFLNAGNVHRWISRIFTSEGRREIDYGLVDQLLEGSEPGSHQVMFLPYITGERFPVMDEKVKGTYVGITPETGKADLIRSCLEGVAFSIRQGIESLGMPPQKISVIGGGARVEAWCGIFADVLGQPVYVYRNADVLPALAIASAVLVGEGRLTSYSSFTDRLQGEEYCSVYRPDPERISVYNRQYRKYLELYPSIREFYN